jgi:outer membrane protein
MKGFVTFAVASVLLAAVASPSFAQSRSVDIIGYATWVDPNGDGTIEDANDFDDLDVEFDSEQGFGVAVNVFWSNRISTEFAASVVEPDVAFRSDSPLIGAFSGGSLEMIPITATLQFHLAPDSRIDPYIGVGAAYVLFDELDERGDLDDVDIESIDFDDDVGLVVNAGVSFDITPSLAIYLDGKYVPVSSAATARFASGPGTESEIDINPLMLSAGLGFQF